MGELLEFPIGVGPDMPLAIPITSTPPPLGNAVDLTTVVNVTLTPRRQDGSTKSPWTATLVPAIGQTLVIPTAAIIRYPFQTTDLDTKGVWRVSIVLNLTDGGHWWTKPLEASFRVTDPFGIR